MRVVLDRDGRKAEADVAADLSSVTVGGRTYPVTRISDGANRVEFEIDGEKVVVENWPAHFPTPFGPVDVNGERWAVRVETGPAGPAAATDAARVVTTTGPEGPAAPVTPSSAEGVAVIPSMPGRVIELKVSEGDRVTKGQTLLILEAMKMRGEVPSPADGVVRDIRVSAGTNARSKEPMMWIRPDGPPP